MGEIRVYEAKQEPCQICKIRNGVLMPYCRDGERTFFFLVCLECRNKVSEMYEVIPMKMHMDDGYFYCPEIPTEFDPRKPILTRYGKKLLEQRSNEHQGKG